MNNGVDLSPEKGAQTVRYTVFVVVPPPDAGPDETGYYQFVATAPVLPRVGESLEFDGPAAFSLSLTVTEVTHWFNATDDDEPLQPFKLIIEAKPVPTGLADAQKLLDPSALERWIARYPTLELA